MLQMQTVNKQAFFVLDCSGGQLRAERCVQGSQTLTCIHVRTYLCVHEETHLCALRKGLDAGLF